MCNDDRKDLHRIGERLEDGSAHEKDHSSWTRRDFLFRVGAATAGATVALGGFQMRALAGGSLLNKLKALETDRVLVLIQLKGGNDGLNTVVPVRDSLYYNARPTISVPLTQNVQLDYLTALNPVMEDVMPLWQDGKLAILRNVGYPEPNLSHFRSTDIWMSGSDSSDYVSTGWVGRGLEKSYPEIEGEPLDYPLAVQIGTSSSLLFQSDMGEMGMSINDVDLFYQIVQGSPIWDENDVPPTAFGDELSYIRQIANNSITYAEALQAASSAVETEIAFPDSTFGDSLAVVSRLIRGGLGAKIYTVTIGSFDTHSNQVNAQENLLRQVAQGLSAFQADLAIDSADQRVLAMTFSEFGRRVGENASAGTDHGTSAPLFVVGPGVVSGLHGTIPSLEPANLDSRGNIVHDMDFRAVYSTVLTDWFGMDPADVADVMGESFESLGFVDDPIFTGTDPSVPLKFELAQNYPNPFNPSTNLSFSLDSPSNVRLTVFDLQGRTVGTLVDGLVSAGTHRLTFDASHLSTGVYIYQLQTPGGVESKKMTLIR